MSDNYQAVYDAVRSRFHGCDAGQAVRDAVAQGCDFSHAAALAQQEIVCVGYQMQRPSVLYRPTVSLDGNKWCALYGPNLMEGVCGFGDSPSEAMDAFDAAWVDKSAAILAALTEAEALRAQIAAGQAREVALREACGLGSRRLGYWCDLHGSLSEDRAALTDMQAALSTPTDTAALRAMLEKAAGMGMSCGYSRCCSKLEAKSDADRNEIVDRVLGGS